MANGESHQPSWPSHAPFRRSERERRGDAERRVSAVSLTVLQAIDCLAEDKPDTARARSRFRKASRQLDRLHPSEATHLLGDVVRLGQQVVAGKPVGILAPALVAWGFVLEHTHQRLEEALDVTETAIAVSSQGAGEAEIVAALLQRGRIAHKLSRYDEALLSYQLAAGFAQIIRDEHSVRLSRIGEAFVVALRGDLASGERLLQVQLQDAVSAGDQDVEARAYQSLAVVCLLGERARDAVRYSYRSVERATQRRMRIDGLINLGIALKLIGQHQTAVTALEVALAWSSHTEEKINILCELIECCGRLGDRLCFARWEKALTRYWDVMMPVQRVEFHLRRGTGLAGLGEVSAASDAFSAAMEEAERHGHHAHWFQAERELKRLAEVPRSPAAPVAMDAETSQIAERLQAMHAEADQS